MKKVAIEFTDAERAELPVNGVSYLAVGSDGKGTLFSASPDLVVVTDETIELAVDDLVRRLSIQDDAAVATIADGLFIGQRITVQASVVAASGKLDLTSETEIRSTASAVLASVDFDAAGEYAILEWRGTAWHVIATTATQTS